MRAHRFEAEGQRFIAHLGVQPSLETHVRRQETFRSPWAALSTGPECSQQRQASDSAIPGPAIPLGSAHSTEEGTRTSSVRCARSVRSSSASRRLGPGPTDRHVIPEVGPRPAHSAIRVEGVCASVFQLHERTPLSNAHGVAPTALGSRPPDCGADRMRSTTVVIRVGDLQERPPPEAPVVVHGRHPQRARGCRRLRFLVPVSARPSPLRIRLSGVIRLRARHRAGRGSRGSTGRSTPLIGVGNRGTRGSGS